MHNFNDSGFGLPMRTAVIPAVSNGGVTKGLKYRQRTIFSRPQLDILEGAFNTSHFPSYCDRQFLADSFGMDKKKIQVWFKNRRTKFRHDQKMCQKGEMSIVGGTPTLNASLDPIEKPKESNKEQQRQPALYQDTSAAFYCLGTWTDDGKWIPDRQEEYNDLPAYSYGEATAALSARPPPAGNGPLDGMKELLPNQNKTASKLFKQEEQQDPDRHPTYTDHNSL